MTLEMYFNYEYIEKLSFIANNLLFILQNKQFDS